MPSSHHHFKRGFTLTELTVCALIVFVLGMLLFPIFARPRHGHRHRPTCASNQKQIALGFLQYIQDYDERFPPVVSYTPVDPIHNNKGSLTQSWGTDYTVPGTQRIVPGILSPYVKSNQLFSDPDPVVRGNGEFVLDYMYNDLLANMKQEEVADVSQTVVTTDAENRFANAGHALTPDSGPYPAVFNTHGGCDAGQGASIGKARLRHSGGAFFSFADGHIKWFKGGTDDRVFFPPHGSSSVSAVDPDTKQQIGPKPSKDMSFNGRIYQATFHAR